MENKKLEKFGILCCFYQQGTVKQARHKPPVESQQQHLALYMEQHLHSVAIMIEVTSHHMECIHFNLNYSQMTAVALQ